MEREQDDLPGGAAVKPEKSVELMELVTQAERDLHMKGLQAIGVNEETLKKLRQLDGLASSTAAFIAMGLEKTHRLYYLAVCDLKTVADQIKERYLDDPAAVDDEQRPFYYRNYIDAVKEFGRAYDLFIQGAAVILRIVGDANGNAPGGSGKPGKPKFTGRSIKQVRESNAEN